MPRVWIVLRLLLPAVWIGLIVGLSFIETPLKFLAPGITTPLGLGIGRLVFISLSVAGWIVLVALTIIGQARPRETRRGWLLIGAMWLIMAVESFLIRPALAARSDVIIAGGDPGESWLHYGYIAAELVLLAVLVWYVVHASRSIRIAPPAA
ncbi:hypothetical protein MZK47_01695 [Microbacterium aerolatum]|uniref:hypothetical protein n=1 Tax=Microbacterium aerolatum TaxID=153731 RepID=UPI0020011E98|nr:hypothetical protein [Microbacterium aerolatum]MCK3768385.1 hypothetical protein [Microbacterium aerolatum]